MELTQHRLDRLSTEMLDFKNEMRNNQEQYKQESRAEIRAMNRKWGELSNKMGTMAEDLVAPTFGHKTAISRDNAMGRACLVDQAAIEFKKIKVGFKMGSIRFFTIALVPGHIQKINASRYADEHDGNVGQKFFADV